jgi:hypothetical protein
LVVDDERRELTGRFRGTITWGAGLGTAPLRPTAADRSQPGFVHSSEAEEVLLPTGLEGRPTGELRALLERARRGDHPGVDLSLVQSELARRTGEAEARRRADAALTYEERYELHYLQLMCPGSDPSRVTAKHLALLPPEGRASLTKALDIQRRHGQRIAMERRAVRVERRSALSAPRLRLVRPTSRRREHRVRRIARPTRGSPRRAGDDPDALAPPGADMSHVGGHARVAETAQRGYHDRLRQGSAVIVPRDPWQPLPVDWREQLRARWPDGERLAWAWRLAPKLATCGDLLAGLPVALAWLNQNALVAARRSSVVTLRAPLELVKVTEDQAA